MYGCLDICKFVEKTFSAVFIAVWGNLNRKISWNKNVTNSWKFSLEKQTTAIFMIWSESNGIFWMRNECILSQNNNFDWTLLKMSQITGINWKNVPTYCIVLQLTPNQIFFIQKLMKLFSDWVGWYLVCNLTD